jgi:hypothetical protein
VASSEKALQHMKRQNGATDGRAKEVPQVFVGGEYRGVRTYDGDVGISLSDANMYYYSNTRICWWPLRKAR